MQTERLKATQQAFNFYAARRASAETDLAKYTAVAEEQRIEVEAIEDATLYLTEAIKMTQNQIKQELEELVTTALNMVFEQPYEFKLEFDRSGDRLRCTPIILDGDREMTDPEHDIGGSAVDTISIALRIVVWSFEAGSTRGTFILDEPFTSLGESSQLLDKALSMIREISQRVKVQLLIITHIDAVKSIADRSWEIEYDGTRSRAVLTSGEPRKPRRVKA